MAFPKTVDEFRFWCQKVLPLVYDDSLSYYEVLCKVTKKINELAESNNDQNVAIQNFIDKATADYAAFVAKYEGDLEAFENNITNNIIPSVVDENVDRKIGTYMTTDTDQTITGVKTFQSAKITQQPSNNDDVANKQYVDINKTTVVQTTGTSESNVISQKGVTNLINAQGTSLRTEINKKQDKLTFDNTPTIGSNNPVTSDGIKKAIDSLPQSEITVVQSTGQSTTDVMSQKAVTDAIVAGGSIEVTQETGTSTTAVMSQNAVTNAVNDAKAYTDTAVSVKQDTLTFDNVPTLNSNNPVKSGGIYTAIQNAKTTIVQETGTSVVNVMSQKAVTDNLNTKVSLTGNETISGTKTMSAVVISGEAAESNANVRNIIVVNNISEVPSSVVNGTIIFVKETAK